MLAKERLLYIMKRLQAQPSISIGSLCKELGISKSTVQRDLKILEDEGKIVRERGGAVQKNFEETMSDLTEVAVFEKEELHADAKRVVCEQAAKVIKDGDLIFIDSGTTPIYLSPYIMNKKIKIVTNCYFTVSRLQGCLAQIYVLGGMYNPKYEVCSGASTIEQLRQFRFDHAFIGANGVDLELGEVYSSEFDIGALKKAVMERSKHSYLLVDDSKYSLTGLCTYGYFKDFDQIYVNDFPKNIKKANNIIVCKERKERNENKRST